ncbi:hypothetical protein ACR6C2_22045 [Streptomyces sp. INA 01156]
MREALTVEGAAPAGRVFKGTAHLNTVVRMPSSTRLVVVRRRLPETCRREHGFLSEHAVLRAIEDTPVAVAAPRALALGVSHPDGPFALHTYEGRATSTAPGAPGERPAAARGGRPRGPALRPDPGGLQTARSAGRGAGLPPPAEDQLVTLVAELPGAPNCWHGSWDCRTPTAFGRSSPGTR